MKRVIEVEMETICKKPQTAINRFFSKYPELDYWKGDFEWMAETNRDLFCDNLFADGEKNKDWRYALTFDMNEDHFYLCVIERA